jgi:hypothetical protein
MKTMIKVAGTVLFGLMALGCSASDTETRGDEGGDCYPNNTCNQGLYCQSDRCARLPEAGLPKDARPPMPDGMKKLRDGGKGKGGDGDVKGKPDGLTGKPDGRLRDSGPAKTDIKEG